MTTHTLSRFSAADVDAYLAVRHEGLTADAGSFRVSVADDAAMGREAWKARLDRDYVVGVENDGRILGIGGFGPIPGTKTSHKGLIWGMYVRAEARGTEVANMVMSALLTHAKDHVRQVQLTAVAANARAVRFYERHGFTRYGVEPGSICLDDGSYIDEALMWRLL